MWLGMYYICLLNKAIGEKGEAIVSGLMYELRAQLLDTEELSHFLCVCYQTFRCLGNFSGKNLVIWDILTLRIRWQLSRAFEDLNFGIRHIQ